MRYDLKGSTYGRTSRKNKNAKPSSTVALKDCDWLEDMKLVNLKDEQRDLILQQLRHDTKFFQDNNINDYSVLLGITKLKGGPREAQSIVKNSLNFDMLYAEGINNQIDVDQKRKQNKRTQSALIPALSVSRETNLGRPSVDMSAHSGRTQTEIFPLQRQESESLLLHERERP